MTCDMHTSVRDSVVHVKQTPDISESALLQLVRCMLLMQLLLLPPQPPLPTTA